MSFKDDFAHLANNILIALEQPYLKIDYIIIYLTNIQKSLTRTEKRELNEYELILLSQFLSIASRRMLPPHVLENAMKSQDEYIINTAEELKAAQQAVQDIINNPPKPNDDGEQPK